MTSPERIEQIIARGILFAKIGAKTPKTSQPMDLVPFFLIMKVSKRHMTSVRVDRTLNILVEIIFQKLHNS